MTTGETRDRMRARVEQWQARLEQLRAERKKMTAEARRASLELLQELRAKIGDEVRQWNTGIDEYDADPNQTTQKEFEERAGLRDIMRQIDTDLAAWKREDHGVG